MLIPSIDLMGGKIVQLVQGEKKEFEFDNVDYWLDRFSQYPLVQLIDLDAARGTGNHRVLIREIVKRLKCQVGGGIRTLADAKALLRAGARHVIIGSALFDRGAINTQLACSLADALGTQPLVFALDSRGGRVAIDGWRTQTAVTAIDLIRALQPFCEGFLYTHIETEGLMGGISMDSVRKLRGATSKRLLAAGGITTQREINELDAMGVDAVVGMAVYTGRIRA